MPLSNTPQRAKLERAGTLHWFHWVIVSLSACVTIGAWYFAQEKVEQKRQGQFDREANGVLQLVKERMERYEDALWSGVAVADVLGGEVSYGAWRDFATSLRIDEKYPGINGLGVIEAVTRKQLPSFLERRRTERPDFELHPKRDRSDYLPITFIEPVAGNESAVGLDVAHELNRYTAALKARDTGQAQITAPITLVQDERQTPGFLFYAPFYSADTGAAGGARPETFLGMVYAPFVFENLMHGILAQETRQVSLTISDENEVLFDEQAASNADYDPKPLYEKATTLSMYGRKWSFDIHSSLSFREAHQSAQPLLILIGGILIDGLLVGLFVVISRTNRKALTLADAATAELESKADALERSNQELERFAYVASHDLQEPLRMVSSFASLLHSEYHDAFDEKGERWLTFMVDGAKRMQSLVRGLLAYSRIDHEKSEPSPLDTNRLVSTVLRDLQPQIDESGAIIDRDDLPSVLGIDEQLGHVFQNLISNAIKFRQEGHAPKISVRFKPGPERGMGTISVSDDGIGIEESYADRIFVIFQRLHSNDDYEGTGIGLAIAKKVVNLHGGRLWFHSMPGQGTTFQFTVPLAATAQSPPSLNRRDASKKVLV